MSDESSNASLFLLQPKLSLLHTQTYTYRYRYRYTRISIQRKLSLKKRQSFLLLHWTEDSSSLNGATVSLTPMHCQAHEHVSKFISHNFNHSSFYSCLSTLKGRESLKIGICALDPNSRRKYNSFPNSSEQRTRSSIAKSQICNPHPVYFPNFSSGENYQILQSSALQHWFKNWKEKRKHKLTASTFAGAIGFWPRRRAQLWLEKLGAIEPFSGNLATCWSNIKEEEALERYKLITGNTVLFPEFQVYGKKNQEEDDWLAASPDGLIDKFVYGLPSRGVLEIKCPFFNGDMSKAAPWSRVPLYCIPQAQGLMEIMDRDWMDFYVWTPKGSSLFRLYRDEEYWDVLKIALSDFWWKHVQPAREVCSKSVISNPLIQLRSFRPAPRHELCSFIVYESKRLVDNSKLLMREINGKLQN